MMGTSTSPRHVKDQTLDRLAETANVAQFVSFGPGAELPQRFARVHGHSVNHHFATPQQAVEALLDRSIATSVNIRSFDPSKPKGSQFIYGLRRSEDVLLSLRSLAGNGLYTIVNETIDIHDGGVSGVALGAVVEFAPDDTPRCVELPGTLALERTTAMRALEIVYGFRPALDFDEHHRVEFSLHPLRVGVRQEHTIIWEIERVQDPAIPAPPTWPNHWSRLLGDKAFGLLMAHLLGLPVPTTTVMPRRIAPFHFGIPTNSGETWLRTCPTEPVPGYFSTQRGWTDPFALVNAEDPDAKALASVLAQSGVDAQYAGGSLSGADSNPVVEGATGYGDRFMLGASPPTSLPERVVADIETLMRQASSQLGPVRMEWAHDGNRAWILQFHLAGETARKGVIVPGEAARWRPYHPQEGLDVLRELIELAAANGEGVVITGPVGITSHVGDLLRKAGLPARFGAG
jgi:hypothetical protein